jgi:membrane-bound lytic murein transglycosylase A
LDKLQWVPRKLACLVAALLIGTVVGGEVQARRHLMPPPKLSEPAVKSTARRTDFDIGRPITRPNRLPPPNPVIEGAANPNPAQPLRIPNAALEPVAWSALGGWQDDDHASAFATFRASCRSVAHSTPGNDARPIRNALRIVCVRALKIDRFDQESARHFFETNFVPIRIRKLGDAAGFLTAYYEPIVDGSRVPTPEFTVPVYRRPPDLLAAGASQPGGPFPNHGRAFRRTETGELVPYYDRGEIEDGALDGQQLEICWLRSANDALFVQIEGSARVRLEDGAMLRLNYDAHNGYPYVPVGRVLIDRKIIPPEEMSMQRIRDWMQANPDAAKDVRRQNRSVVFFRVVGLTDHEEALGAQGIPLSAGRSIAVDNSVHVLGTPFFIEADLPLNGAPALSRFRRTMIAQDTGSAIVGPARADLYFGAGEEAGRLAGRIRQPGRFSMLIPRELDPSAMGIHVPIPPARPVIPVRFTSKTELAPKPAKTTFQVRELGAESHRGARRPHP